jgi:hypothetical protein
VRIRRAAGGIAGAGRGGAIAGRWVIFNICDRRLRLEVGALRLGRWRHRVAAALGHVDHVADFLAHA